MHFSRSIKLITTFILITLLSNVPALAAEQMIPTSEFFSEVNSADVKNEVQTYLSSAEVETELIKLGLTHDEISERLANMSPQEINQLSVQVKEARAGGDILVAVLLIVLILYFVKRI